MLKSLLILIKVKVPLKSHSIRNNFPLDPVLSEKKWKAVIYQAKITKHSARAINRRYLLCL